MSGFIKLMRQGAIDLIENDPNSFLLLALIALRARWCQEYNSIHGLGINQCFVGDYQKIGLTISEYRTAKKHLSKAGYADFKRNPRKGTIATLLDTTVFDINSHHEMNHESPSRSSIQSDSLRPNNNDEISNAQPLNHQPMTTQHPLTKKEEEEKETTARVDGGIYKCLEEDNRLSFQDKLTLMRYSFPENRVKLALNFSRKKVITGSLLGLIIWHCREKSPPEPNKAYKITVEQRAWEYNDFLRENGYLDLVAKNMESIHKDYMHIPAPNKPTTISLNKTLDEFEKDLAECSDWIRNTQKASNKSNIT